MMKRVRDAMASVLFVCVGIRVADILMAPLLPSVFALVFVAGLILFMFRRTSW